jgi:hypothetical protein
MQYLIASRRILCCLICAMRRALIPCTFIFLVAATLFLWQYRFERDPRHPTLRLADLRQSTTLVAGAAWAGTDANPTLALRSSTSQKVVQSLALPNLPPTHWLHLRFQTKASQLQAGKYSWNHGRFIVEWHTAGKSWQFDPISSANGNKATGIIDLIARPGGQPATPSLRIENLATSGDFLICMLEATVVRERMLWTIGRVGLFIGWVLWFLMAAGFTSKQNRIRSALAAAIWLATAITLVFPGPWKNLHPLNSAFQLGPETRQIPADLPVLSLPAAPSQSATPASAANAPKVGQAPTTIRTLIQDSLILRIKNQIIQAFPNLRLLIHILLLLALTLPSIWLIGQNRSVFFAILISIAIEAAQFFFGYGFDHNDILDLLCDAGGIGLALWTYRIMRS